MISTLSSPWQALLIDHNMFHLSAVCTADSANPSWWPPPALSPAQIVVLIPGSPVLFTWKSVRRCSVDGSSFSLRLSCRLKGEFFWLSAGNPRKEPWRTSCSRGAWRRGMAAAVVPAATGVPASPFSPGDVVAGVGDTRPGWAGPGAAVGAAAASVRDMGDGGQIPHPGIRGLPTWPPWSFPTLPSSLNVSCPQDRLVRAVNVSHSHPSQDRFPQEATEEFHPNLTFCVLLAFCHRSLSSAVPHFPFELFYLLF